MMKLKMLVYADFFRSILTKTEGAEVLTLYEG